MVKPKYSFKGGNAKNARIRIDYSGRKPKVEFSYPSKKHGVEGSMFPLIFFCWVIIFLLFRGGYAIQKDITEYSEMYPGSNNTENKTIVDGVYYNVSTFDGCVDYLYAKEFNERLCNITTSKLESNYTELPFSKALTKAFKDNWGVEEMIMILLLVLPPLLIYFPFKKKWQNVYPKWQAKRQKKVTVFKTKDIKYSTEEGYYCELPVFKNIILNYETKKEFGKYLKFIEIREHKFKFWMEKSKRKMRKAAKKRRKEKMLNEWIWYAKFYFTKKPITGQLEVIYR